MRLFFNCYIRFLYFTLYYKEKYIHIAHLIAIIHINLCYIIPGWCSVQTKGCHIPTTHGSAQTS